MQTISVKVMNEFLSALLPEVERCLPDWERVKARHPAAIAWP